MPTFISVEYGPGSWGLRSKQCHCSYCPRLTARTLQGTGSRRQPLSLLEVLSCGLRGRDLGGQGVPELKQVRPGQVGMF